MSRIRTIKPEFWTSEQIVECSPTARLLFIGFWNFADDNGVLPASAKHIKMLVYPGDDFTVAQVQDFIDELLYQRLLAAFTGEDGRAYWYVTGWKKHQKIDKPSNKYPSPPLEAPKNSPIIRQPVAEPSPTIRQPFADSSPPERSGVERKGREKQRKGVPAAGAATRTRHTPLPDDFAISPAIREWANAHGYGDLDRHLENFKDKAAAKGYQYSDWDAAFRNAIRDD